MPENKDKPKQKTENKPNAKAVPANSLASHELSPNKKRGRPPTGGKKYTDEEREKFKKSNYWKYPKVKEQLVELLDGQMTAKEVAEEVNISVTTLYKYKALAQLDTRERLITCEERKYLAANIPGGNHY